MLHYFRYKYFVDKFSFLRNIYDVIRIDHFRGFDSYYAIPYGAHDATCGEWRKGPGIELFNKITEKLGNLDIIVEDLGFLTDSVRQLLSDTGYPGMKVLQFAFNPGEDNFYLPHNHKKNCVVYTGTHDNNTIEGWIKEQNDYTLSYAKKYLKHNDNMSFCQTLMAAALSSVADTAILTMQDILGLDERARMNIPSTLGGNWQWRAKKQDLDEKNFSFLKEYTNLYYRNGK